MRGGHHMMVFWPEYFLLYRLWWYWSMYIYIISIYFYWKIFRYFPTVPWKAALCLRQRQVRCEPRENKTHFTSWWQNCCPHNEHTILDQSSGDTGTSQRKIILFGPEILLKSAGGMGWLHIDSHYDEAGPWLGTLLEELLSFFLAKAEDHK